MDILPLKVMRGRHFTEIYCYISELHDAWGTPLEDHEQRWLAHDASVISTGDIFEARKKWDAWTNKEDN